VTSVAPGWYKDPAEPSTQRYWDGEGWVGAPLPADATPPPGPPPTEPPPPPPAPPGSDGPTVVTPPAAGPPPHAGAAGPPYPNAGYPLPPGSTPPPYPASPPPPYPASPPPPYAGSPSPPYAGSPPPLYPGMLYPGHAVPPAAAAPGRMIGVPLASPGARFVARLIDIGAVLLLNVLVNGWFVYRYVQEVLPVYREVNRRMTSGEPFGDVMNDLPQPGPQASTLQIVILLIAAALWFAYEVPAVANTGQTLGKRVTGIKVVGMDGSPRLGFGRSLRRWNILGLPTLFWTCCVGFIWQFVECAWLLFDRPLQQAVHDKAARTVVVHVPKAGPTPRTDTTPGGLP
jgi:uncharacterized RDD family membrane protein YckC